jgi:catechol-2,3-dioxygenase
MRTADLDGLERFYAEVLGLTVVRRDASRGSVWLRLGGAVLMLERADHSEPSVPADTRELLALAIDDREAWRAWLAGHGVHVEAETAHTLYFRDPDGRRLAVSTYPLAGG